MAPESISIHKAAQLLTEASAHISVPSLSEIPELEEAGYDADDDRYFFQTMSHRNAIVGAIQSGKIRAIGEFSRVPVAYRKDGDDTQHIRRDDFLEFAGSLGFSVADTAPEKVEPPAMVEASADNDAELAALFDLVKAAQLEAMFPDRDARNISRWPRYVERAERNGLKKAAKDGRAMFNPYRAAIWWLTTGPKDWKLERCLRVLSNNLPARSIDSKHMLTGEYE